MSSEFFVALKSEKTLSGTYFCNGQESNALPSAPKAISFDCWIQSILIKNVNWDIKLLEMIFFIRSEKRYFTRHKEIIPLQVNSIFGEASISQIKREKREAN